MSDAQARYWRSAANALAVVRRRPGVTRTELAGLVGLRSGPASDLLKRLTQAGLVCERPVAQAGAGRPTTTVHAHPEGPVVVVLDLRHGDWRLGTCDLDGVVSIRQSGTHGGTAPYEVLETLAGRADELAASLGERVVGAGISVPGLAFGDHVSVTMLDWPELDVAPLASGLGRPVVVGNDATMAGIAEARMHPAEATALLHIVVEVGIGGALVVDGRPTPSAHGLHGEFGHLPFGDPGLVCPCGARGCWTASFDVPQIARLTGLTPGPDPRDWLRHLFTHPDEAPGLSEALSELAVDLGRGIAGLVNALDPGLVTLGGMAESVRLLSPERFDHAFADGLMKTHRTRAPRIVAASAGEDATLVGVGLSVFDQVLDAQLLARWASREAGAA